MKKRSIAIFAFIAVACAVCIHGTLFNINSSATNATNKINSVPSEKAVWTPIQTSDELLIATADMLEFNLERQLDEADYIFSGIITNTQEYSIEWIDEYGDKRGPFYKSVLEVRIEKEYAGESPVESEVIRVYYPNALNIAFQNSFIIQQNKQYVFVTREFDQEFNRKKKQIPGSMYEHEKYADVFIPSNSYDIMPIENGNILLHKGYLQDQAGILRLCKPVDPSITKSFYSLSEGISNDYVSIDIISFNEKISKTFEGISSTKDEPQKVDESSTIIDNSQESDSLVKEGR